MSSRQHNSEMHKGHRIRMRRKYREQGFDYFEMHEILEMLLFFIVPRRDTNPLAHNLLSIDGFGSFHKVLDADISKLMRFGLPENIASYLKFVREMSVFYLKDRQITRDRHIYPEKIRSFFQDKPVSDNSETVYALLMDVDYRFQFCGVIAKRKVTVENFPLQHLIELCLLHNAQNVVISHNFPKNSEVPIKVNQKLTKFVNNALANISVELIDHINVESKEDVDSSDFFSFGKNIEMLEKYLSFLFRNKEVDELSKNLIVYFGSVSGIFDANFSALKDFGLSDTVATYLKIIPDITRVYLEDKRKERFKFVYPDTLCSFFRYKYIGRSHETLYGLLLDEDYRLLYCGILSKGAINNTDVPVQSIMELCCFHKPKYAVISHNHPHTSALPSQPDIDATSKLKLALDKINVELIDHIIVSATEEVPLNCRVYGKGIFF